MPTAAILDLAAMPGIKIHLIPHGDAVAKMTAKYGPVYFVGTIPKGTYGGMETDVQVAALTNLLAVHERMDESLAYQITKLLLERTADLVAIRRAQRAHGGALGLRRCLCPERHPNRRARRAQASLNDRVHSHVTPPPSAAACRARSPLRAGSSRRPDPAVTVVTPEAAARSTPRPRAR